MHSWPLKQFIALTVSVVLSRSHCVCGNLATNLVSTHMHLYSVHVIIYFQLHSSVSCYVSWSATSKVSVCRVGNTHANSLVNHQPMCIVVGSAFLLDRSSLVRFVQRIICLRETQPSCQAEFLVEPSEIIKRSNIVRKKARQDFDNNEKWWKISKFN